MHRHQQELALLEWMLELGLPLVWSELDSSLIVNGLLPQHILLEQPYRLQMIKQLGYLWLILTPLFIQAGILYLLRLLSTIDIFDSHMMLLPNAA